MRGKRMREKIRAEEDSKCSSLGPDGRFPGERWHHFLSRRSLVIQTDEFHFHQQAPPEKAALWTIARSYRAALLVGAHTFVLHRRELFSVATRSEIKYSGQCARIVSLFLASDRAKRANLSPCLSIMKKRLVHGKRGPRLSRKTRLDFQRAFRRGGRCKIIQRHVRVYRATNNCSGEDNRFSHRGVIFL